MCSYALCTPTAKPRPRRILPSSPNYPGTGTPANRALKTFQPLVLGTTSQAVCFDCRGGQFGRSSITVCPATRGHSNTVIRNLRTRPVRYANRRRRRRDRFSGYCHVCTKRELNYLLCLRTYHSGTE